MECWKEIDGFPGYEVSSQGKVKSIKKILKASPNHYGYPMVSLWRDKKPHYRLVHRLVAEAFIPNPENKPTIDHINRDRANNCVENLRWATKEEQANNMDSNRVYPSIRPVWIVCVSKTKQKQFSTQEEAERYLISLSQEQADTCE